MDPVLDGGLAAMVGIFLAAAIRIAAPLLLASLGELVSERGGVLNLGLEGAMLAGALAAALAAEGGGAGAGLAASLLAGSMLAVIMVLVSIWLRADQVITGTALTLGAIGLTGTIFRQTHGVAATVPSIETLPPLPVPLLSGIPILGPALFAQPFPVYVVMLLVPATWLVLYRTRWGLALRAAGESPEAARAAGVAVRRVRAGGVLVSGALGGLAGGILVLAQVGTFAERMTAGRGFVAIALVVLGRWHPVGVAIGAVFFGVVSALQYLFQALGYPVPYQLFLMLPYVLTLAALAGAGGRGTGPAALGKPA